MRMVPCPLDDRRLGERQSAPEQDRGGHEARTDSHSPSVHQPDVIRDHVRPASAPVVCFGSCCVPNESMTTPKACAMATRRWLLLVPEKTASPGWHHELSAGQSGASLMRRPIRSVPPAPPASTVGTFCVLCSAGLPMSLAA